ncbi:hypothetical protein [Brumimicrobium aurantiacum]|nr:hypothetical protein [Brumimicrobium aurantiacum]
MARILSILFLIPLSLIGQENNLSENLISKEFLTRKGGQELDIYLSRFSSKEPKNLKVINFLADAFYQELFYRGMESPKIEKKIKEEDPILEFSFSYGGLFGGPKKGYKSLIHHKRSVMGATRSRTLEELKSLDLISIYTYNESRSKLADSTIRNEVELLMFVKSKEEYFIKYNQYKSEELKFAQNLIELNLIDESTYQSIENSYSNLELKGKPAILSYSDQCQIINLHDFEPNPTTIYNHVFEVIKQLVPNFNYSDLQIILKELEEESDLVEQRLEVSFVANNKTYKNEFFHDFKRVRNFKEHHKNDLPNKISTKFHQGINKYLRDKGVSYRLHTINIKDSRSVYGQEKIGLIILNEEQSKELNQESYFLSDETFDNRFNTEGIEKILQDFESIGLFSHLTKEEFKEGRLLLESKDVNDFNDILFAFPKIIVSFDWETGNLKNPYQELTNQFGLASRGVFNPTNIKDNFEISFDNQNKVEYSFSFKNKTYSSYLDMQGDWLDPKFMAIIEKSLSENEIDGKFQFCYDNGQETGFIFLTQKQREFIESKYPDLIVKYE